MALNLFYQAIPTYNIFQHVAVYVGEPEVASLKRIGKFSTVYSLLVKDGGLQIVYKNGELQPVYQDPRVHSLFHHGYNGCVDTDENLHLCRWDAKEVAPITLERG